MEKFYNFYIFCLTFLKTSYNDGVNTNKTMNKKLLNAIHSGNFEKVIDFVKDGCDINEIIVNENISIIEEIFNFFDDEYCLEILKTYFEYNQNPKITNKECIFGAVCNQQMETINFLIEHGLDINMVDESGETPIFEYLFNCDISKDYIEYLISIGADINVKNKYGQTPLMLVIENDPSNGEILMTLLENGADYNIKDNDGKTAMNYAIMKQSVCSVLVLCGYGCNIKPYAEYFVSEIESNHGEVYYD